MRKPVIAGNWKMHKTVERSINYAGDLLDRVIDVEDVEIIICPPFTALDAVLDVVSGSNVAVGAQNMHWEAEGAYTGEVSPLMLRQMGCRYVILGHSERRQFFGETDENVNKKIKSALRYQLIPLLCVGETLEEREQGVTQSVLKTQAEAGLAGLDKADASEVIIAYEPVWAIGTGKTASNDDAQAAIGFIRGLVSEMYGTETGQQVRILYGGSVKPENITGLMREKDIDGALVGGASLEAENFAQIIKF